MPESTPHTTEPSSTPREVSALNEISGFLTRANFDEQHLLKDIVATATNKMGLKAGAIRLIDEETTCLVIKAVYGLSDRFLSVAPTFDSESRFARLIQNEGILQIADVSLEPDLSFAEAATVEGIVSLLAVGLFQDEQIIGVLSVYTSRLHHFTELEIQTLRIIANHASIALQLTNLYEAQLEVASLQKELTLAADIQEGILPKKMPALEGFEIAGHTEPWQKVGGDFYDFIHFPQNNLGIAISDVSGKSIPAALLMVAVRMALRSHVEHEYHVREIMRRVNRAIFKDTLPSQFVTLFYGILNVPSKILTYVNAGHPPPLLFRDNVARSLETGGVPIGVLPDFAYQEESIALRSGDLLVLYTDGYTDVTNVEDEFFEVERFVECITRVIDCAPIEIIEALDESLDQFVDENAIGDDRTIVVLKVS